MKELTSRQRDVLGFITDYIRIHAYPPTIREIGDRFAISVKGAYDHVEALRKKGFLRLGNKRSRTIEVVKAGGEDSKDTEREVIEVPLLGTVAAGRPILSEENWERFILIPRAQLKKNATHFAVRVRGDSMIGAGINDGDIAVIESREYAEDREIVATQVDDNGAVLKRFFKEPNRVRLESENPKYSPIYTQNARILGRLVQILRSY
jgi:repressor LexA